MLRTILSQAMTDELVTRTAARAVKLPPVRTNRRKSWTSEEARRFLESARVDGDPHYVAYVLVLVLGPSPAGATSHDTGLLVTTRYGTELEPRNFNRFWNRRCEAAGVRQITVHDARRTCGSLLADLDVHPRVAMQILRHAQFAITMEIYTQVSSAQTREAIKRLGESLG